MSRVGRPLSIIKWILGGTVVGGSVGGTASYLHHHDWDIGSTGVVRFGRAVVAAAGVVVDYKRSLYNLDPQDPSYAEVLSKVHRRAAERLRAMCCINRGCFIKVGQHVGALDYLLPTEYVETFRVLHSDAPQSPVSDLAIVFKEETGRELHEVFSSFDDKPCGTASLAQVHKATLHDGTLVAVKIQHPQVKAHSFIDMKTMELLTHAVAKLFPGFKFVWLSEETKRNLPLELDFYHEARNCERASEMFQHYDFIKIPEVHWNLTTERVLTMEYCEGGQVNDKQYFKKHNIDVNEVSRMLGKLYSEMIFVKGYVHCDPHPGNVLVHKSENDETKVVLLDHGLYVTLTDKFRLTYCELWRSLLSVDRDGIKNHSYALGIGALYPLFACMVTARAWTNIEKGIDKVAVSKEEDNEIKENAAMYLAEITEILNSVPREMLLIFKTNDLLRGIEQNLGTRANARSFITMSRCCIKAVFDHEANTSKSWLQWTRVNIQKHACLLRISIYEFYLWLKSSYITKAIEELLRNKSNLSRTMLVST